MIGISRIKDYCKDFTKIENYEEAMADTNQVWHCHHKMEKYFPSETLKAIGWYYDCRPDELIFLTPSEHRKLHNDGTYNPMYGKKHSKETREKISKVHKGKKLSEENKRKLSEVNKNRRWYTNGVQCVFSFECPKGFHLGRK